MAKTYEHEIRIDRGNHPTRVRQLLWELNDDPPSANIIWENESVALYFDHVFELFQGEEWKMEQSIENNMNTIIDISTLWYLNGELVSPLDMEQDYYDHMYEED